MPCSAIRFAASSSEASDLIVTSPWLATSPAVSESSSSGKRARSRLVTIPQGLATPTSATTIESFLGPMARYSLNSGQLSDVARAAAEEAGLDAECRNPFRSIVVRAVEILYALDEALRLIEGYEPPD